MKEGRLDNFKNLSLLEKLAKSGVRQTLESIINGILTPLPRAA